MTRTLSLLIVLQVFTLPIFAQCSWTTVVSESFEYATVIPGIVPGTTYQDTPQSYAGTVHSGSTGMYLNITDGYTGQLYSQAYTNLCSGLQYRVSFWTRDAWTSSNNFTFNVRDAANTILATQTVVTNSAWQQVTLPEFSTATGSITFEIISNIPGGPGNDGGFDDFQLQACNPVPSNTTVTFCQGEPASDLFGLLSGVDQSGVWTGPSALTNGYQGTFSPAVNTAGQYVYTIDGGVNCPASVSNVQVTLISQPDITAPAAVNSCGPYTLPAITGTDLSGNEHYYTGTQGSGTMLPTGSQVTTSQTIYLFGGSTGCSDEEVLNVTISAPSDAGGDNGAAYCGPGPVIDLNFFRSSGSATGGTWSETTAPPSGSFNAGTAQWPTQDLAPGTYTFSYSVPASGSCPADDALFTVTLGNIASVDLGNDTTLCPGQTLTLNAGTYDNYLWNNGSTNPTRFVSAAGTYSVKAGNLGANQIINGDFETTQNFTTQYIPGTGGTWGLVSDPGTYVITTSPNLAHSNFVSCTDHSPNPGTKQLVVNGDTFPNTQVWCQNVPIQPDTDYEFGTWVTSVEAGFNVAQLQFTINSVQLGSVFSPGTTGCNWSQFTETWSSGMTTSAEICIVNQNTNGAGNDFALDDITFRPVCYSRDTIVVTYSISPVVDLGPAQNHCEGASVTLDAQNPGLTYLWNTAETTQTISPTTSGSYAVTVRNAENCATSANVTVTFEAQKNAGPDSLATLCNTTASYDLNDLLGTAATAGGNWQAAGLPGTVTPAGIATTSAAGNFEFAYIVTGSYCPNDTAVMTITVNQQPEAATDQFLHKCNTSGDQVNLVSFINHPSAPNAPVWITSTGFPSANLNTSSSVVDLTGIPHGNYTLSHVLSADSMCVADTMNVTLQITAVPVVSFSSDTTEGCQPLDIRFYNESTAQGTTDYFWDLGNGQTSTQVTDIPGYYEAADCYNVSLTVVADGLCSVTATQANMICAHPIPFASFDYAPQQVYSDGPVVNFDNTSEGIAGSSWDFGDGSTDGSMNPVHTFPLGIAASYEVELSVVTQFGCVDTTTRVIQVKDQLLYFVPNTFTPDGDEHNNVFLPVMTAGMDPMEYTLQIFNRWGELVFESHDINTGWDGTYHGELLREGVFVWKIEFGMMDNDEVRTDVGHVNLIR